MNPLPNANRSCLTLRELVVPVPGWSIQAPEPPQRFLVYAPHAVGQQGHTTMASGDYGLLGLLEPFVIRLSRAVGKQVLGDLMRRQTRRPSRPSMAGCPDGIAYHRAPFCARHPNGG